MLPTTLYCARVIARRENRKMENRTVSTSDDVRLALRLGIRSVREKGHQTFHVELIDRTSRQSVWHGSASVHSVRELTKLIEKTIRKMTARTDAQGSVPLVYHGGTRYGAQGGVQK